jgi:hypothetical protein
VHDLVDPPRRDVDLNRQPVLRDAEWLKELLGQDLAGMDAWVGSSSRSTSWW